MSIINSVKKNNVTYKVASSATFTCSTASSTAAKTISGLNASEITDGLTINVLFEHTNAASNPTLNGYVMYQYGTTAVGNTTASSWQDNEVVSITFLSSGNTFICRLTNGSKKEDKIKSVRLKPTLSYAKDWSTKSWSGLPYFEGRSVWTDGENIYCCPYTGTGDYVLNKKTSTWDTKIWSGLSTIEGSNIWTDGDNIYYSSASTQKILNKSTSTWSDKTWTGLTSFGVLDMWTDGDNIYYSFTTTQYVLNKSTSTWSTKTWTGLTSFNGRYIWTDGDNIYYSNGANQYILNKSSSTWLSKVWTGLSSFDGNNVWTDGDNIYSSASANQYILDKRDFSWVAKTWTGVTSFAGNNIWTDGDNIYYSYRTSQYVLNKTRSTFSPSESYFKINNYGSDPKLNDGTSVTQPGGANPLSIKTNPNSGSADTGIFRMSDDNTYICGTCDNEYLFALFNKDYTKNFSDINSAEFAVRGNGDRIKSRGKEYSYKQDVAFQYAGQIDNADYVIDIGSEGVGAYMLWKAYGDNAATIEYCSGWDSDAQEEEWSTITTIWTGIIMVHFVTWGVYVVAISNETSRNYYGALNPSTFYRKKIRFNVGSTRAIIVKLPV